MWRYEVLYREDGVVKNKGFGYRDKYERFLAKCEKKGIKVLATFDGDTGVEKYYY